MRAYVLPDARLVKLAGRFVRLDVNTEEPRSAPFVEKFPIDAWPTLLVVDPVTEQVVLRWVGTATAREIERLALDGERALRDRRASAVARADRLAGERRHAEAAAAYREALAAGGEGLAARDRVAESLVQALSLSGDPAACAAAARDALRWVPSGPRSARIAAQGLSCALDVDGEAGRTAVAALEPQARRALSAPGVLADDRAGLYDTLASAREAAGDRAGAKTLARAWLAFLEAEARRAPTPAARAALDGQRLSAALRLGQPERVLPALLASERALPDDFVPASNLAVLYLKLGRAGDALAAADRALARASGPRRVRVLIAKADAQAALGRSADARATLAQAVREGEEMPESVRPKRYVASARQKLKELPAD